MKAASMVEQCCLYLAVLVCYDFMQDVEEYRDDEDWYDDDSEIDDDSVNCPECGREMSGYSDKCPSCGRWLTAADRRKLRLDGSSRPWLRLTAAILVVGFLFFLLRAGLSIF